MAESSVKHQLPQYISDPLKKWCSENHSSPEFYKNGMSATNMLSFLNSMCSTIEPNAERQALMEEILDTEEPDTRERIHKVCKMFALRDSGLSPDQVAIELGESKTEEETGAGAPAIARRGSLTRGRASSFREAPAPAAAKKAAPKNESHDAEKTRYSNLWNNYMEYDFNKNKVKRTGWTKVPASYKVACLSNSSEDICYIVLCFVALYICISLIFIGLLNAYLATQDNQELLYICVGLLVAAWTTLLLVVMAGNKARERAERDGTHDLGIA